MTLVAVRGPLGTIAKAAAVDEDAALSLLHFAAYEALCDEADRVRPALEADVLGYVTKTLTRLEDRSPIAKTMTSDLFDRLVAAGRIARDRSGRFATTNEDSGESSGSEPAAGTAEDRAARALSIAGRPERNVTDVLRLATQPQNDRLRNAGGAFWDRATGPEAKYERLGMLGNLAQASGEPHAVMAGTALRMAAALGPEAQAVLEPGIKRTAYRYRGTERRPDRDTARAVSLMAAALRGEPVEAMSPEDQRTVNRWLTEVSAGSQSDRPGGPPSLRTISPEAGALRHAQQYDSPDKKLLAAQADYLATKLRARVPSLDDAKLSLEAGKMPPSIGIMLDADGDVVTEAMGFNGDHYLPFDLKNLRRLNGGQYVRTRTTGGLTDEDIYTGLVAGARQVTVVSNSGVFTLEFDPALRGARRHSDKSRQMVDRYAKLIERVGSGEVEQTPISREQLRGIKAKLNALDLAPEIRQQRFDQEVARLKAQARFDDPDEQDLEDQAEAELHRLAGGKDLSAPQQARFVRETMDKLRRQHREAQYRTFRLDGDGYAAAQKALQTEFPFFIRDQRAEPLRDFLEARGQLGPNDERPERPGPDIGRTPRGGLQQGTKQGVPDVRTRLTEARSRRPGATPPAQRQEQQGQQATGGQQQGQQQGPGLRTPQPGVGVPLGANGPQGGQPPAQRTLESVLAQPNARPYLDLTRELSADVAVAVQMVPAATPQASDSVADVLIQGGPAYAKWAMAKYGISPALGKYLATEANERELTAFRQGLVAGQRVAENEPGMEDVDFAGVLAAFDTIAALRQPWAAPDGPPDDPARTRVPDGKPPEFPDVAATGVEPARIAALVAQQRADADTSEVVDYVQDFRQRIENGENETIRDEIQAELDEYESLFEWATNTGADPNSPPPGIDVAANPDIAAEAMELVGPNALQTPRHRSLENKQKAWAIAHWAHLVSKVTGMTVDTSGNAPAGGGGAPFGPAPQPGQPQPGQRQGFSMRDSSVSTPSRRVVLHKADSPVARALARSFRR